MIEVNAEKSTTNQAVTPAGPIVIGFVKAKLASTPALAMTDHAASKLNQPNTPN
jgi:hypothetical protein